MERASAVEPSISEQALYLLDLLSPRQRKMKSVELFAHLNPLILSSFAEPERKEPAKAQVQNTYSVASRLNRSNYEDHAKAEALLAALKQLRQRRHAGA